MLLRKPTFSRPGPSASRGTPLGRLALVVALLMVVYGCATTPASLRPEPLRSRVSQASVVVPAGTTPRFVVDGEGYAVGLVYYARWVNYRGGTAYAFRLVRRHPEDWVARTEVLQASDMLSSPVPPWMSDHDIPGLAIAAAVSDPESWWWTLEGDARIPRVRVEAQAEREGAVSDDRQWEELGSRNPALRPWFQRAVASSSLVATPIAPEVAAAMVAMTPGPRLEPGARLSTVRDGRIEQVLTPARLTRSQCPYPLHTPVPDARVSAYTVSGRLPAASNDSGLSATLFALDRTCSETDRAACQERRNDLHLGVCQNGWQTLELGAGRDPALHVDPDGQILVAFSRPDGMHIQVFTAPQAPSTVWTAQPYQ